MCIRDRSNTEVIVRVAGNIAGFMDSIRRANDRISKDEVKMCIRDSSELVHQFIGLAGMRHPAHREPPDFRWSGAGIEECREHGLTDSAFIKMILDRHQPAAGRLHFRGEGRAVEWLDAVKIDHADGDSLPFQLIGSLKRFVKCDSCLLYTSRCV